MTSSGINGNVVDEDGVTYVMTFVAIDAHNSMDTPVGHLNAIDVVNRVVGKITNGEQ
jgi:hypothetical protein